jgi:hypothetical protein
MILILKKDYFWHIMHKLGKGARGTSFIQKFCYFIAAQHLKCCSEAFADAKVLVPCCRQQRHNVCGGFGTTAHQRQHHASTRPASLPSPLPLPAPADVSISASAIVSASAIFSPSASAIFSACAGTSVSNSMRFALCFNRNLSKP